MKVTPTKYQLTKEESELKAKAIAAINEGKEICIKDTVVLLHVIDFLLVLPFDPGLIIAPANVLKQIYKWHDKLKLNLNIHFFGYEQAQYYQHTPYLLVVHNADNFKVPKKWESVRVIETGQPTETALVI